MLLVTKVHCVILLVIINVVFGLGHFGADYNLNDTVPLFRYTSNNTLDDIEISPITSVEDNFIEGDETIKFVIFSERNDLIQVPNSRQTATVTIIDNDCKYKYCWERVTEIITL